MTMSDQQFNRRISNRVAVNFPVMVKIPGASSADRLMGQALDLGESGIVISCAASFPKKVHFSLTFKLPNNSAALMVSGRLVESLPKKQIHRVHFVNVRSRVAAIVADFISRQTKDSGRADRSGFGRRKDDIVPRQVLERLQVLMRDK